MVFPKTVRDIDVQRKKVLVRVDFNVPLGNSGEVRDSTRLEESIPTLHYLLSHGASIILMSHLGRPGGKYQEKFSLRAILPVLNKLLNQEVKFAGDCIGTTAEKKARSLNPGEVLLLENLRFHAEEEKNDSNFAKALATHGDIFVNDAFGSAHRAHASTTGITHFLPSVAGFLLEKELRMLSELLSNPKRPFWAILGGAKVSNKIGVLQSLLPKVDVMLFGGAMAFTFLKAQGYSVGDTMVEEGSLQDVLKLLKAYPEKIKLPLDCVACTTLENPAHHAIILLSKEENAMKGQKGVDIGPKTSEEFSNLLLNGKPRTIFWNGPLGIFEVPDFSRGTLEIAKALGQCAKNGAAVVVGGGDSIAAMHQLGFSKTMTYLSTGGGASLEFLEGKTLPGISALLNSSLQSNANSSLSC